MSRSTERHTKVKSGLWNTYRQHKQTLHIHTLSHTYWPEQCVWCCRRVWPHSWSEHISRNTDQPQSGIHSPVEGGGKRLTSVRVNEQIEKWLDVKYKWQVTRCSLLAACWMWLVVTWEQLVWHVMGVQVILFNWVMGSTVGPQVHSSHDSLGTLEPGCRHTHTHTCWSTQLHIIVVHLRKMVSSTKAGLQLDFSCHMMSALTLYSTLL